MVFGGDDFAILECFDDKSVVCKCVNFVCGVLAVDFAEKFEVGIHGYFFAVFVAEKSQ